MKKYTEGASHTTTAGTAHAYQRDQKKGGSSGEVYVVYVSDGILAPQPVPC